MASRLAYRSNSDRVPMPRDMQATLAKAFRTCSWCRNPGSDEEPANPEKLCRSHLAEYEGLSESELDRMEAEERADTL